MIALKTDGSMVYLQGDILPAGAVRCNADGTAYTPPVTPTPAPPAPAAPQPDRALQAAMMRAAAAAEEKIKSEKMAEIEETIRKKYGLPK